MKSVIGSEREPPVCKSELSEPGDCAGAFSGDKFVGSRAGEAVDVRDRGPNRKFRITFRPDLTKGESHVKHGEGGIDHGDPRHNRRVNSTPYAGYQADPNAGSRWQGG